MDLIVTGMTCEGCVRSVTKALKRRDADASVSVDLASGKVHVDGALTAEDAKAAITDAGFDVQSVAA